MASTNLALVPCASASQDTDNTCMVCLRPFADDSPPVALYMWVDGPDVCAQVHDKCYHDYLTLPLRRARRRG